MAWHWHWHWHWPAPRRGALKPQWWDRWAFTVSLCGLVFAALWVCVGWGTRMAVVPASEGFGLLTCELHDSVQAATFGFLLCGRDSWSRHCAIKGPHLVFAAAAFRALTWP